MRGGFLLGLALAALGMWFVLAVVGLAVWADGHR